MWLWLMLDDMIKLPSSRSLVVFKLLEVATVFFFFKGDQKINGGSSKIEKHNLSKATKDITTFVTKNKPSSSYQGLK